MVDIVDCTGSGDVSVSHVVKATPAPGEGGAPQVTGLSGRYAMLAPRSIGLGVAESVSAVFLCRRRAGLW